MNPTLSTDDIFSIIQHLSTLSDTSPADGITRLAYSPNDELAHQFIVKLAKSLSLDVRQDFMGNLFIRLSGYDSTLPAVGTGSHLDTVPNGGMFDGILGVVAGLYALSQFELHQLKRDLELIVFRSEESSRFGISCIGSKTITGNAQLDKWHSVLDADDKNIMQAIDEAGYQSEHLSQCELTDDHLSAFVELHIEQGKCLESANKQIGIVTDIAAPTRFCVEIFGQADHSGATPMDQRQDALVTAALLVSAINQLANQEAYLGTVATVGKLDVLPNAMNVIPGYVRFFVDIRGIDSESINRISQGLYKAISQQDITIEIKLLSQESPVKLNAEICQLIESSCIKQNLTCQKMLSGAGHDAMYMAQKYPTAMIFIPSEKGISHHKDEYSKPEDIISGAKLLTTVLAELANK